MRQDPETLKIVEGLLSDLGHAEEALLQCLDELSADPKLDQRWLAVGRTHLEQAFMAIERAIKRPRRLQLED